MEKDNHVISAGSAVILERLREVAAKPLSMATAIPKDLYISPDILRLETERLFYGNGSAPDEVMKSQCWRLYEL